MAAGMHVLEVTRANRAERRLHGKSDSLDAHQAALSVLAGRGLSTPKQRDGDVDSMRVLLAERSSATKARTASMDQIHGLLVSAPEAIRQDFRRYDGNKLTVALARTRPTPGTTPELIVWASAKRLALRRQNPTLMAANGVGPFVASRLLVTFGSSKFHVTSACGRRRARR